MTKRFKIPVHLAVIMDGNGRWAKKRNMPRFMGHVEGAKSVRAVTEACVELGIKYLTFYAFSTENWKRPKKEIGFLMKLLNNYIDSEFSTMMKNNVRFHTIGDISRLPGGLAKKLEETKKKTSKNTGLNLILALNYGSRMEILAAVRQVADDVKNGRLSPDALDEKAITERLYTKGMPDPDLMIRTSGEMRISNFLLWQLAYSELYVTRVLWPDFRKKELLKALKEYSGRERRYGGVEAK
ncbi:MAG: isoprenyl transferase [Spirochaetia bacterium]|nr:isoprenyl transferase [Spirochaetia bacterium]